MERNQLPLEKTCPARSSQHPPHAVQNGPSLCGDFGSRGNDFRDRIRGHAPKATPLALPTPGARSLAGMNGRAVLAAPSEHAILALSFLGN
jgi:hypothetical protein